jgi:alpha-1,2-mannosyltransferase
MIIILCFSRRTPSSDHSSRFSLVVESWGTMMLAYKALQRKLPHIFIDTTGCAFTYVVARILGGCQVVAYVHYPTISTDMLALVWARRPTYNNDSQVAQSRLTTYAKLVYYVLFAMAYGCVGSLATLVMVNSTWTYSHIFSIWRGSSRRIKIVFPPCDVDHLQQLPLEHRQELIVSIGQFRPEKDHSLQIRTLKLLMERDPIFTRWTLVLIGSCRGEADEARRRTLSVLIESLQLQNNVHFVLNQPSSTVKRYLGEASIGLHTMWNEHFGIGVVEMMAAGLLVVAHKSGGPKTDILTPLDGKSTGYLAATAEEYADAICEAIALENTKEMELRGNARKKSQLFSDQVFTEAFQRALLDSGILGLSKSR